MKKKYSKKRSSKNYKKTNTKKRRINPKRKSYKKKNKYTKRKSRVKKYTKRKNRYYQNGGDITSIEVDGPQWFPDVGAWLFRIIVTKEDRQIKVVRRYSNFEELDSELKKLGYDDLPLFPGKLSRHTESNLESRRIGLEGYLNSIKEIIDHILSSGTTDNPIYKFFMTRSEARTDPILGTSLDEGGSELLRTNSEPVVIEAAEGPLDLSVEALDDKTGPSPVFSVGTPPTLDVCNQPLVMDNDLCSGLCNEHESPLVIPFLNRDNKDISDGLYIYAISKQEGGKMYYYAFDSVVDFCPDTGEDIITSQMRKDGTKRSINHNCLVGNKNVFIAGTLYIDNSKKIIYYDNHTGHYHSKDRCLGKASEFFKKHYPGYKLIEENAGQKGFLAVHRDKALVLASAAQKERDRTEHRARNQDDGLPDEEGAPGVWVPTADDY